MGVIGVVVIDTVKMLVIDTNKITYASRLHDAYLVWIA